MSPHERYKPMYRPYLGTRSGHRRTQPKSHKNTRNVAFSINKLFAAVAEARGNPECDGDTQARLNLYRAFHQIYEDFVGQHPLDEVHRLEEKLHGRITTFKRGNKHRGRGSVTEDLVHDRDGGWIDLPPPRQPKDRSTRSSKPGNGTRMSSLTSFISKISRGLGPVPESAGLRAPLLPGPQNISNNIEGTKRSSSTRPRITITGPTDSPLGTDQTQRRARSSALEHELDRLDDKCLGNNPDTYRKPTADTVPRSSRYSRVNIAATVTPDTTPRAPANAPGGERRSSGSSRDRSKDHQDMPSTPDPTVLKPEFRPSTGYPRSGASKAPSGRPNQRSLAPSAHSQTGPFGQASRRSSQPSGTHAEYSAFAPGVSGTNQERKSLSSRSFNQALTAMSVQASATSDRQQAHQGSDQHSRIESDRASYGRSKHHRRASQYMKDPHEPEVGVGLAPRTKQAQSQRSTTSSSGANKRPEDLRLKPGVPTARSPSAADPKPSVAGVSSVHNVSSNGKSSSTHAAQAASTASNRPLGSGGNADLTNGGASQNRPGSANGELTEDQRRSTHKSRPAGHALERGSGSGAGQATSAAEEPALSIEEFAYNWKRASCENCRATVFVYYGLEEPFVICSCQLRRFPSNIKADGMPSRP